MKQGEIGVYKACVHRKLEIGNQPVTDNFHVNGFDVAGQSRDQRQAENGARDDIQERAVLADQNIIEDGF